MKEHEVTTPQIGLVAGTRAMLGAGIALLLAHSGFRPARLQLVASSAVRSSKTRAIAKR